jgi:MoxR-like ATPase
VFPGPQPAPPPDYRAALDPKTWEEVKDLKTFDSMAWTRRLTDDLIGLPETGPAGTSALDLRNRLVESLPICLGRLRSLETALNARLSGKSGVIEALLAAAIAHLPALLVGEPGTAKSMVVDKLGEGLGLNRIPEDGLRRRIFKYLLNAFTEPDEVEGPVNIRALQAATPKFTRLRRGSITEAELVFLDEVFQGNFAILNALLSIMNERQVYEGADVITALTRLIFGATNVVPPECEKYGKLWAFYERFVVRVVSEPAPMEYQPDGVGAGGPTDRRVGLRKRGWENERAAIRAGYRPQGQALPQAASLNDLILLNRAVAELFLSWDPADIGYDALVVALAGGEDAPALIDDRKYVRMLAMVRAAALLRGGCAPEREDLWVFHHVWRTPNTADRVREIVDRHIRGI